MAATLRRLAVLLVALAPVSVAAWADDAPPPAPAEAVKPAETPVPEAVKPADPAEEAAHHAAAVALLDQLHPADAVNAMMPSIIQQIRVNVTRNDPDLLKEFNGFAPQLAAEGEAAKPELMERIVAIYAKTFTTQELRDVTAFYQSPTGRKMIATQSQVTGDTMSAVRDWGTKLANQMFNEARAKLQAPQP